MPEFLGFALVVLLTLAAHRVGAPAAVVGVAVLAVLWLGTRVTVSAEAAHALALGFLLGLPVVVGERLLARRASHRHRGHTA